MNPIVMVPVLGPWFWALSLLCGFVYALAFLPPKLRRLVTGLGLACLAAYLIIIDCDWWICCVGFLCI